MTNPPSKSVRHKCAHCLSGHYVFVLDAHLDLTAHWWSLQWAGVSSVSVTPRAERCDWWFPAHFSHSVLSSCSISYKECGTTPVAVQRQCSKTHLTQKMRLLNRRKVSQTHKLQLLKLCSLTPFTPVPFSTASTNTQCASAASRH